MRNAAIQPTMLQNRDSGCMFISFVIIYDLIHHFILFFCGALYCGIVLFGKGCQMMCLRRQHNLILYLLHWKQIPSNANMCARLL